jgi:DNA uptake protein ComE-like DNA-binding protein
MLALTIKWSLPYWAQHQYPDITSFAEEIAQFRLTSDIGADATEPLAESTSLSDFFYFDPNRTTDGEWNKLGLNERQIRNIRNYQASGGSFRRKEDLQKLYTISATQYQQLEPYIRFTGNEPAVQLSQETSANSGTRDTERFIANPQKETKLQIELNTADSSLLTQLSGIGPVLAARTIRYRNLIGGFSDVSQLGEVFGIQQDLVVRLAPFLSADSSFIRRIPVNTATFNDLTRHPYLNEQQVRGVMNYRRLQNRINNLDELVQNNILKREEAEKIRPYLSFE